MMLSLLLLHCEFLRLRPVPRPGEGTMTCLQIHQGTSSLRLEVSGCDFVALKHCNGSAVCASCRGRQTGRALYADEMRNGDRRAEPLRHTQVFDPMHSGATWENVVYDVVIIITSQSSMTARTLVGTPCETFAHRGV